MKEKCFVERLSGYILHTSANVLEEAGFKIIITSVLEDLGLERTNFYKIKDAFESGIGVKVMVNRLHVLNFLKSRLIILSPGEAIFDISKEIIERDRLLPNDALIAATCKHYGIKKIATFDEDFKRVDFLEVVMLL